jgi:hypothetical protein
LQLKFERQSRLERQHAADARREAARQEARAAAVESQLKVGC